MASKGIYQNLDMGLYLHINITNTHIRSEYIYIYNLDLPDSEDNCEIMEDLLLCNITNKIQWFIVNQMWL